MPNDRNETIVRSVAPTAQRVAQSLNMFTCLISIFVLFLGWFAEIEAFRRILPEYRAMVPSTAICFALASAAVLVNLHFPQRIGKPAVALLAVLIMLIVSFSVSSQVFAIWTLNEEIHLTPPRGGDSMSSGTALCFILISCCLFSLAFPRKDKDRFDPNSVCATSGLLISTVAIAGYSYNPDMLYHIKLFSAMALHTAACFFMLFFAFLLLNLERNWVGIFFGQSAGSRIARRLFPSAVVIHLIITLSSLGLFIRGVFTDYLLLALIELIAMTFTAFAIIIAARDVNLLEAGYLNVLEKLKAVNKDKEYLLRELHHRVKNNLQQVAGLLWLEAHNARSEDVSDSCKVMSQRVAAIAAVHEQLTTSETSTEIRINAFLIDMLKFIREANALTSRKILLFTDLESISADMDTAISIGLIVNELVVNSLKHAFSDGSGGLITVSLRKSHDEIILTVTDSGKGMSSAESDQGRCGMNGHSGSGVGTTIVNGLVQALRGEIHHLPGKCTTAEVRLPTVRETASRGSGGSGDPGQFGAGMRKERDIGTEMFGAG